MRKSNALKFITSDGKRLKLRIFCLLLVIKSLSVGASELTKPQLYDLLLAGGALQTCSSMSLKNCRVSNFDSDSKKSLLYEFSADNAKRFVDIVYKLDVSKATVLQLHSALMKIYSEGNRQYLERNAFLDLVSEQGLRDDFIRDLADPIYFALLDTHETIQIGNNGMRRQEDASVAWTSNSASQEIYRAFVDQAKLRLKDNGKPRIAVVTASSRDPFESADFYLSVFESLGADVVWLPLDASFQQARFLESQGANGCERLSEIRQRFDSFERERIYPFRTNLQKQYCQQPELLHDILANVQGIFFNGGDQSRTLAALNDPLGGQSAELDIIERQLTEKLTIIGGTSAGTAVQAGGFFNKAPVPMISSGQSDSAMENGAFPINAASQRCADDCTNPITTDDLTYKSDGGTGLFPLGVLDTHFSERDREARLAVLVAESKQRFGFGVDETTAMLVSFEPGTALVKVIGKNGVFMLDGAGGQYNTTYADGEELGNRQLTGMANFLPSGSTAEFDYLEQEWKFSIAGESIKSRKRLPQLERGRWRNESREWCSAEKMVKWRQRNYEVALHANENSQFSITMAHDIKHCGYVNWPYLLFSAL